MYKNFFKRIFDIVLTLPVLIVGIPLFLLVAILIKIDSSGPIFFTQYRLGKDAAIFKMYKFRTMTDKKRSVDHEILKGDSEVTCVGKYLRRFKIDELPQLINVLIGDLSIVGPRPCMPELQAKFDENGKVRTKVRPGLTGLSQINGNIYLGWADRWVYDKYYVDNISLALDFRIIFKTFFVIFKGEDKFLNLDKDSE
jgi:Sugar transferases involved in lipopolysaccharide synthesis